MCFGICASLSLPSFLLIQYSYFLSTEVAELEANLPSKYDQHIYTLSMALSIPPLFTLV